MRLRFNKLFSIRCRPGYIAPQTSYSGIVFTPLLSCSDLLSKYALRFRQSAAGIEVYYQTIPQDFTTEPLRPVNTEQVFYWSMQATDVGLAGLAALQDLKPDHVYILRNAIYNTTGTIIMHDGALQQPVKQVSLAFKQTVELQAATSYVELLDINGNQLTIHPVRALQDGEVAGTKTEIQIDARKPGEGEYVLRHVFAGGSVEYPVFCTADYAPGRLAIVAITYRSGAAYTGIEPVQQYLINIDARSTEWFYDVHIAPRNRTLYPANELQLIHRPADGEPAIAFAVEGVPEVLQGRVTFKSAAALPFPAMPLHFDLVRQPNTVVLPRLPLPNTGTLVRTGIDSFASSVIINL